jgi:PadR family transcriptional regulator, regulatory protein PadR
MPTTGSASYGRQTCRNNRRLEDPVLVSSRSGYTRRFPIPDSRFPIPDMSRSRLGELELLVMLALVRLGEDAYGVSIRQEIERRSGHDVAIGAVYAALVRLGEKRLVTSWVSDPLPMRGGRARKHWRLTAAGERAIRDAATSITSMLDGLTLAPRPRRS